MSKRKNRIQPADDLLGDEPSRPEKEEGESRASLAITVFWCLTGLATALTEAGVLAAGLIINWRKPEGDELTFFQRMFGLLYLASLFAGILLLVLTPLVYRFRDEPPPREITWTAIFIGALPIMAGVVFYLLG